MSRSSHVTVQIDLNVVRANVEQIAQRTGRPILAVIKADAYGLGAMQVAETVQDHVEGYCVYHVAEASDIALFQRTGKRAIALGPADPSAVDRYLADGVRPGVCTVEQAEALRRADPVLCVDTGMQRFSCPIDQIDAVIAAGGCTEAFTHAIRMEQVRQFVEAVGNRGLRIHAAATALLDQPDAWLDAVRPGLAMYRSAVRVSARLIEVRPSRGPVGYRGFTSTTGRHGLILAGYCHGLRPGPCRVNGRPSRIPEVGMQSAYVELWPEDHIGDEVVLLGDGLSEAHVAAAWNTSAHEALLRLCGIGRRTWRTR